MMLLAVAGIPMLRKRLPAFFIPVAALLLIMIYVQSSWWSWWFGGGFGLRAYIDIYAILAIPLAATLERILSLQKKKLRVPAISLVVLLILFQMFNTYQYSKNYIHYVGMNRYTYLRSILRVGYHPDHWTTLSMPDYELARKGIYVFYLTGNQYKYIEEMEPGEGLEEVRRIIGEDKRLGKEISWYAQRSDMEPKAAMEEVTERMYLNMTKQ